MGMVTYEDVLRDAQQLTAEERLRLLDTLLNAAVPHVAAPTSTEVVIPLTESERTATLAALERIDQLAVRIDEAWKDDMSAAEAVKEQRREL
jgi:hypothetical protein